MEGFNISLAARMTGLTEFTLRAWEKRYGIAKPHRNESGRRVYNLQEIEKLKLLKQLTATGHSIQDLAKMDSQKLKLLARQGPQSPEYSEFVHQLLVDTANLNIESFSAHLKSSQHEMDTRTFLMEIVSPFLGQLGQKVESGEFQIYHEHIASAILRNTLSGLLYSFSYNQNSKASTSQSILFATPEGEWHEFGILIASILTALKGFRVLYLGPNMPVEPLCQARQNLDAKILVLASSSPKSVLATSSLKNYLQALSESSIPDTEIWLGGDRFAETTGFIKNENVKLKSFKSFQDFERALQKL